MNQTRQSHATTERAQIKLLKNQVKELNAQIGHLQEELSHYEDGVQRLPLVRFIEYAENYPPEQNEYARVVKEVLRDVYTTFTNEERVRLRALGHKPQPTAALCVNGHIRDIRYVADDFPAEFQAPASADTPEIPDCLDTPKAHDLLQRLAGAGYVDEHWQPCGLSIAERGELAATLAERLGLKAHWQLFGKLWGDNPETLRKGCFKAQDQRKTFAFKEAMKQLLG